MTTNWKKMLVVLVLSCVAATPAFAQEGGRAPAARGKKISIDEVKIVGKIVKPQVQFIISREKGTSERALDLKESFVPRIMDSVQEAPF